MLRRDAKRNETRRRAGTWGAPFGYLALFWTLAAFSFCWRAAQSEAERPSGTYLGVFNTVSGRAFAASSTALRRAVTPKLSFILGVSVQLRQRAVVARDSQPQILF